MKKIKTNLKLAALLFISFIFNACVSSTEHDKALSEIEELKNEMNFYKSQLDLCQTELNAIEAKKNAKPYITEAKAKELLADYYSFYRTDYKYKNAQIRRSDNNVFIVSLRERSRDTPNEEFWYTSMVYKLTVNNDGTYQLGPNY